MARKLKSDHVLFIATILLVALSVVMVYSASAPTRECATTQRHRGVDDLRPGLRIAATLIFADSIRRTTARPSAGSMTAGDWRNAECPHAPGNSSNIQEYPAEAVPYMGSLRASDWLLHGTLLAAVIP